jgi:pimeloyl-ACP methyl ester carboxylesterase
LSTFVLVHGGGHGGWCYAEVARRLRAAGHDVRAPSLPGCGEHAPLVTAEIDLDSHIEDIVSLLFHEDLKDVILVGHSYGGMVITGVADRAADRIQELVYLDAAHPVDGESLRQVAAAQIELTYAGVRVHNGAELVMWPMPGMATFFGITDPGDIAWTDARLTPHPWKTFDQPLSLRNGDTAFRVPRTNINCTAALNNSPPDKRAAQLAGGRNFEIDTGHDLMITEPDWVAGRLIEIAEKPLARG